MHSALSASHPSPHHPTLPFQVCGFNDAAPASGPATEETPETSGLLTRSPCPVPVAGVASQVVVAFVGGGRRNDVTAARLRAQVQAMSNSADKPSLLLLLLLYPNASCQRWPAFAMTVVLAGMAPPPRLAPSGNPLPARLGTAFSAPGACGGAALWVLDFRDHAVGLFGCGQVDEPNFTHLFWDSRKHLYRLDIPLHRLISRHGHRLFALDMNLSISPPWRRHPPPRTATALFGWVIWEVGTGFQVSTVNLGDISDGRLTSSHIPTGPSWEPGNSSYPHCALTLKISAETFFSRVCASEDPPSVTAFRPPSVGLGIILCRSW